jgi:hypothetical protein
MKRRWIVCGLVTLGMYCGSIPVHSEEGKTPEPGGADMEAMMKEWAKWSNPTDMHKHLEKMAGNWTVTTKMWMDPSAPPTESKGAAKSTFVLGGRWLRQEYTGDMMGMPFEGIGMTGYDNFKKEYISTWTDNMSTTMMRSTGSVNAAGTEFTMTGTMDEPMTGERDKKFRHVWKLASADSHVFEAYDNIPGKGEVKVMELTYTRVK